MTNIPEESSEIINYRRNFKSFYDVNLKKIFDSIEIKRKEYLYYFTGAVIFSLLLYSVLVIVINISLSPAELKDDEAIHIIPFFLVFLAYIVTSFTFKRLNKENIMNEFIKYFPDFKSDYGKGFADAQLKKYKTISPYTRKENDDYFEGVFKDTKISISEEKHLRQGIKREDTAFKGIIIAISVHKNFQGQTVLFEKNTRYIKPDKLDVVKLEDVSFEKKFNVFSSDQIEARFLLTPAFMNRMIKLKQLYKGQTIKAEFLNNCLLISIETSPSKDMFETASIFKSATGMKHINETLEQFLSILSIVDILKLDQKIGM